MINRQLDIKKNFMYNENNQLLNIGCGNRYHKDWINVDFHSTGENVISHNLLNGIPFENERFSIVYHSHVIEHFSKEDAPKFIAECYRVLKPNGIIRIAFPDFEQIVKQYIRLLNELKKGNEQCEADYDWIMLELLDQTVRNVSGGEMLKYCIRESIPNEKFLIERCGIEIKNLIEYGRRCVSNHKNDNIFKSARKNLFKILKRKGQNIIMSISRENSNEFKIGKFRLGGEIHQWMYDSYSLGRLLKMVGFKDIIIRDAFTSYFNNWQQYNLDTEIDGSVYKPDSTYIEAIK